jgi:diguanylate cyclase (GGDEF)-like protein
MAVRPPLRPPAERGPGEVPLADHPFVVLVVVGLVALWCGWQLALSFAASRTDERVEELSRRLERERLEGERALARIRRQLEDVEQREHEHSGLFQMLPELVAKMFAAKGRRELPPIALKLVEHAFRPEQAAFFVARSADRQLVLAVGRGLPASFRPGRAFPFGEGRIGYVAGNRLTMDDGDFQAATALVRRQLEATEIRDLRADVVAPIEGEGLLLGVLCIGKPTLRQGHAKRLLKMLADLTGMAMVYVHRLRSTQEAASVDSLTGALNKRALLRHLSEEILKAERDHVPLSLLILDIDHFKNYNDTNGHVEGDAVLKSIGQILQGSIREDDVAARYGGEEFIVLYPGASKAQALVLADQLRESVATYPFTYGAKQPGGRVTISGGVATFPEDARGSVELIRSADQALYEAKGAGRNKILGTPLAYLT